LEFEAIAEHLQNLLDENPRQAIAEAEKLDESINFRLLKAAIFVDAGAAVKEKNIVSRGVEIYQSTLKEHPKSSELQYNLANGFHALASSTPYDGFTWYQETHDNRKKAKSLFYASANARNATSEIRSQAFTNLGNLLRSSYRWVEAYDYYILALNEDRHNAVASSGALKILRYAITQNIGDVDLLNQEIEHLAAHIISNKDSIQEYAGKVAVEGILAEIDSISAKTKVVDYKDENEFIEFVIANNLTLSPTIHSHKHMSKRWDVLGIASVTSDIDLGNSIPEIFAMFNVIKSDFILARHLLFNAVSNHFEDTGTYSDTLDYACYGVNESALALAQRAALDILDKIAVAALSYLNIAGARYTSFKQAWFKEKSEDFAKKIEAEISVGNTALLALTEIARDLIEHEGYLHQKQNARNSSTHRFTVLHDFGSLPESESRCLEHYEYDDFSKDSLLTLKLARCAIIYFVQMIQLREERLEYGREGLVMPMTVPSHEYIRGHDE